VQQIGSPRLVAGAHPMRFASISPFSMLLGVLRRMAVEMAAALMAMAVDASLPRKFR
jgi:hypothetical protein